MRRIKGNVALALLCAIAAVTLAACAKMGQPDGGWYDETPPRITSTSPADKGVGVKSRKIVINFDEYITVENATEKVVVSPPQLEAPEIKGAGKKIIVELKDSLKANTTYTVDFSDAISDNNEGNPLGNYTYSFSTSDHIDTLEVSGNVVNAENLEPIKGILVGLYALGDSVTLSDGKWAPMPGASDAFLTQPLLRVSRTDSRGRFVIRGIAPGSYRIVALQDADGNYLFNQKSEMIAFSHDIITPACGAATRQDTVWRDSLHIDSIQRVGYTRFTPDDIVLRAFTEQQTDRYFLKTERTDERVFTVFFSGTDTVAPVVRGLNFADRDAFIIERSQGNDTISYWLRDTTLINQDTLRIALTYNATDTLGLLQTSTDTLDVLAKTPYERRMKNKAREYEDWKKDQDKAKKRGKAYLEEMPPEPLEPKYVVSSQPEPNKNIRIEFPTPLQTIDTTKIHLYAEHDSLWYNARFLLRKHTTEPRVYELLAEWRPGIEYSVEIDSAAFTDIYGHTTDAFKQGLKVKSLDEFGTLLVNISGMPDTTAIIAQLLDQGDKVVSTALVSGGTAEFFYVNPGTYYLRLFADANGNGKWDTGLYAEGRQAEQMTYYPEKIECKAKWDITLNWDTQRLDGAHQKPSEITKQKPEKDKTIKRRNVQRAQQKGIPYPAQ